MHLNIITYWIYKRYTSERRWTYFLHFSNWTRHFRSQTDVTILISALCVAWSPFLKHGYQIENKTSINCHFLTTLYPVDANNTTAIIFTSNNAVLRVFPFK